MTSGGCLSCPGNTGGAAGHGADLWKAGLCRDGPTVSASLPGGDSPAPGCSSETSELHAFGNALWSADKNDPDAPGSAVHVTWVVLTKGAIGCGPAAAGMIQ